MTTGGQKKNMKRGHVKELKFHYMTKDPGKRQIWEQNVVKGRSKGI
jgi:hypothetical protein